MSGEWKQCKWGDLATLEYGRSLRGYENASGQFPVYGTNGLIGRHSEPLCKHSGVIIGRKGAYRGIHYSSKPFYVIDTAFYLNPRADIDLRWAYYALLMQDINSMDSGSAIPSTSRGDFYALSVKVPPRVEQQAMAQVLSSLDDKIALNHRTNETLEAVARAIFKSWFVGFDPVRAKAEGGQPFDMDAETAALFPDSFEDSPLGKIPKGWQVRGIGEVVSVAGGSTPRTDEPEFWEGTVSFATPKDMSSLKTPILLETERGITELGVNQIGSGLLPKGTVLLSSRAPIGYLAIAENEVTVNQGIIAMVCDKELPNLYVLQWTKQNMETIIANANGTTFLEISKANFRSIQVIVPSAPALCYFTNVVGPLYRRMVNNLVEANTLAAIRDALLPKLISGEIRVKDAPKMVGETV